MPSFIKKVAIVGVSLTHLQHTLYIHTSLTLTKRQQAT
jgi:hypothetical protein